jgi:hypothetical protein
MSNFPAPDFQSERVQLAQERQASPSFAPRRYLKLAVMTEVRSSFYIRHISILNQKLLKLSLDNAPRKA